MLFEDFDKKIKEAADQHHPAYDEKAWQKMEKLLDQHLPQQKDDRRRILFSLLVFLLIGGGAYLVVTRPRTNNDTSPQLVREIKTKDQAVSSEKSETKTSGLSGITSGNIMPDANKNIHPAEVKNARISNSRVNAPGDKESGNVVVYNSVPKTKSERNAQDLSLNKKSDQEKTLVATADASKNQTEVNPDNARSEPDPKSGIISNNGEDKTIKSVDVAAKNETQATTTEQISKPSSANSSRQKKNLNNGNGFSFFVSAGPDVSKAGDSKTGKTTLLYGAGVGYTKNRITLRTGIYASKKIYWAGSRNYELAYTPTPPTKFEGADANCDVIDIPVKLSYAFNVRNKNNWFAGIGLSSYLMKKEKYVYTYKTAATTFYYPYQTKNENKHYFSIFNLSAGYTRQLNNTISISVEPYAEIPLTGIGVGKVHLNSGGVLLSVGIRPFKK